MPWVYLGVCAFYVALQLSPSHYALVFDQLGIERHGLVAGEPRRIRSDEWNIHTPLVQIAVANDFERTNQTSVYREDLRSLYPLPPLDWGLPFKPAFWGSFVGLPASAFSMLHALRVSGSSWASTCSFAGSALGPR